MSLSFLVSPPVIPRHRASVVVRDGAKVKRKKSGRGRTPEENHAYYLLHRERLIANVVAYGKTPAGRAAKRRTYLRHREREIEKKQAWYRANREHVLAMARERYRMQKAAMFNNRKGNT